MTGDFTRNSDDQARHYSGVLQQQGRVALDADWNEQHAIHTRALRNALRDLIGPHGGPSGDCGFDVTYANQWIKVGPGIYYVDGIRVEARDPKNSGAIFSQKLAGINEQYVVFLEVWERHVNMIEDPAIREPALLGPDTATRLQVQYAVRVLQVEDADASSEESADPEEVLSTRFGQRRRQHLAAQVHAEDSSDDPCLLAPESRYRGRENQLYRVEIHDAAPAEAPSDAVFTFKWSRDNGSVVFPILSADTAAPAGQPQAGDGEMLATVRLAHLGRDARYGLVPGDIVEFIDDTRSEDQPTTLLLHDGKDDPGRPAPLGRILTVDPDTRSVTIAVYGADSVILAESTRHPYLRRWDHREPAIRDDPNARTLQRGAIPVHTADLGRWLPLENGVEVRFEKLSADPPPGTLRRSGDYWQIPARVAIGDLLWPKDGSTPLAVPPHGVERHYAPLALVAFVGGTLSELAPARRKFGPLASL